MFHTTLSHLYKLLEGAATSRGAPPSGSSGCAAAAGWPAPRAAAPPAAGCGPPPCRRSGGTRGRTPPCPASGCSQPEYTPPLVFYGGFMVNLNTAYRVCFEIKLLKHPVLTMFDCSTNQHGGAAPGSPQLVAVLALARVYQRGLGHLNIFRSSNIFVLTRMFLLFCKKKLFL